MSQRIATALLIGLGMLSATAGAQEQGYNEDAIRPSKFPRALLDRAAKEAPGARFSAFYTERGTGYRIVGQKADGSWVSVRFLSGDLYRIWNWKVIPFAKAPKAIARTLLKAVHDPKAAQDYKTDLSGFVPSRLWLVDEFTTFRGKEEKSTFYEYVGKTAKSGEKAVRISPEGKFLGVRTADLRDYPVIKSRNGKELRPPACFGNAGQPPRGRSGPIHWLASMRRNLFPGLGKDTG